MLNISLWPIDRTLPDATTLDQSGPGSDGNKEVLCIPQSSSLSGASPSDCLVLYPGHSCFFLSLCRETIGIFYSPSRLGHTTRVRVDLRVTALKRYFTISTYPKPEPNNPIEFRVICKTPFLGRGFTLYRGYSQRILSSANKAWIFLEL